MIILQPEWDPWPDPMDHVNETMTIHESRDVRISALLGPDGEPLTIVKRRHKIGFDLRPRKT
jgi:hypothetical protein